MHRRGPPAARAASSRQDLTWALATGRRYSSGAQGPDGAGDAAARSRVACIFTPIFAAVRRCAPSVCGADRASRPRSRGSPGSQGASQQTQGGGRVAAVYTHRLVCLPATSRLSPMPWTVQVVPASSQATPRTVSASSMACVTPETSRFSICDTPLARAANKMAR